jgi:CBS-domain-containing membrane protein
MSNPVISVAPDEPIEVAARLMVKNRVGALPAVEGSRRIGIVTETNLLRHICQARTCTPTSSTSWCRIRELHLSGLTAGAREPHLSGLTAGASAARALRPAARSREG